MYCIEMYGLFCRCIDLDVSCPLGDPYLSLYSLEEQGYKESILFGTIQYLAVHAEQRRARLDLVGWATSDGAAHVLSCGYRGPYPHIPSIIAIARTSSILSWMRSEPWAGILNNPSYMLLWMVIMCWHCI